MSDRKHFKYVLKCWVWKPVAMKCLKNIFRANIYKTLSTNTNVILMFYVCFINVYKDVCSHIFLSYFMNV